MKIVTHDKKRFDTKTSKLVKTEVSKEGWIIETYKRNKPMRAPRGGRDTFYFVTSGEKIVKYTPEKP